MSAAWARRSTCRFPPPCRCGCSCGRSHGAEPTATATGAMLFAAWPVDRGCRGLPNFTERSSPLAPGGRP
ncbi:hypothetical protein EJP67_14555 [Variovorax guangxiensis]|uniref:Uncharacterized protein n=1 Tax=Variovorax guangxiensis TaxID=1775474 RepID=A0A433MLC1_9BURK|nr:hypothetical protein EJP67_14555 [Variovorax guangxiensis]